MYAIEGVCDGWNHKPGLQCMAHCSVVCNLSIVIITFVGWSIIILLKCLNCMTVIHSYSLYYNLSPLCLLCSNVPPLCHIYPNLAPLYIIYPNLIPLGLLYPNLAPLCLISSRCYHPSTSSTPNYYPFASSTATWYPSASSTPTWLHLCIRAKRFTKLSSGLVYRVQSV